MRHCTDFSDLVWLFTCDNRNRGIIRQNFDEAALLWKAVQTTDGPILEIGRRHGGSTVLLLEAGGGRSVTSIDIAPAHHPACQMIFDRILSIEPERLRLLVGDSRQLLPGRCFGLLYIDGDHSYEGVKADTIAHWDSLRPFEGKPPMIVYHDAVPNDGLAYKGGQNHCEGVFRLCHELIGLRCANLIAHAGSSVWLEKITELPASSEMPTTADFLLDDQVSLG